MRICVCMPAPEGRAWEPLALAHTPLTHCSGSRPHPHLIPYQNQNFVSDANLERVVRYMGHGSAHYHAETPSYYPSHQLEAWDRMGPAAAAGGAGMGGDGGGHEAEEEGEEEGEDDSSSSNSSEEGDESSSSCSSMSEGGEEDVGGAELAGPYAALASGAASGADVMTACINKAGATTDSATHGSTPSPPHVVIRLDLTGSHGGGSSSSMPGPQAAAAPAHQGSDQQEHRGQLKGLAHGIEGAGWRAEWGLPVFPLHRDRMLRPWLVRLLAARPVSECLVRLGCMAVGRLNCLNCWLAALLAVRPDLSVS